MMFINRSDTRLLLTIVALSALSIEACAAGDTDDSHLSSAATGGTGGGLAGLGGTGGACVVDATEPCYSGADGTEGIGLCTIGTRVCVLDDDAAYWSACEGEVTPSSELCDSLDNDCDGVIDETEECVCASGQLQACYSGSQDTQNIGACVDGTQTCDTMGSWGVCVGEVVPDSEQCDGIDNDCDGQTDEGNPGGGTNCSTNQPGACAAGTFHCQGGALACVSNNIATAETCDGVDNDCDGQTDEGNPGGGTNCSTGQQGMCAAGTLHCQGGALACVPNNMPTSEVCDGLNNDCDGSTDEGNPGGGGSCSTGQPGICSAGTVHCQGGALACVANSSPTSESCNGLDDDCDGTTDEGCLIETSCPAGQFATSINANGTLDCTTIAAVANPIINNSCSVYLGWRDNCDGCTTNPSKWGRVSATSCQNGLGTNTCSTANLGGSNINLFGLNTDGDVSGDDKFYWSFHCGVGSNAISAGPCGTGELMIDANSTSSVTCKAASGSILGYVRNECYLYSGWRDSCNNCTTTPAKWGRVNDGSCTNGLGEDNTCTVANLGGALVRLYGLNTNGDVSGDDKFYTGLRCPSVPSGGGASNGPCPAGQFIVGTHANQTIQCARPDPQTSTYFRNSCNLYHGWRDNCNGCTTAPAKWGRSRDTYCTGVGSDSTCQTNTLGGVPGVRLFGLNPDGDVNGDDKFYVGFKCF